MQQALYAICMIKKLCCSYDVEKRSDSSNYDVNRPLLKGKNKKVIALMKDQLGGKVMTEFAVLCLNKY